VLRVLEDRGILVELVDHHQLIIRVEEEEERVL
jgi:hypothetical protein